MITTFTIPGEPVALPRERVAVIAGKPKHYRTGPIVAYQQAVQLIAKQHFRAPRTGPVRVILTFALEQPVTTKLRVPAKRPDIDNLVKGVLDALNGVAWLDDKQVVELVAKKCWADGDPMTLITVESI